MSVHPLQAVRLELAAKRAHGWDFAHAWAEVFESDLPGDYKSVLIETRGAWLRAYYHLRPHDHEHAAAGLNSEHGLLNRRRL